MPQSDSNFGNFGEEARGTDDELAEDPLGDIFGDILNGFGNLVQEGMKLITNVTESDVSFFSIFLFLLFFFFLTQKNFYALFRYWLKVVVLHCSKAFLELKITITTRRSETLACFFTT